MVRVSAFVRNMLNPVAALLIASTLSVCAVAYTDSSKSGEPVDPKARSIYAEALEWQKHGDKTLAVSEFRKANKQDGGHCLECLRRAYLLANSIGDYKDAADVARDWLQIAGTDADKAALHYRIGVALQQEGMVSKKDKWFSESCDEFKSAQQLQPKFTALHYSWGVSLAYLHQDDAARAEFSSFINEDNGNPAAHERAQRYAERIELARARMAPPFAMTTLDGQHVTMDSLAGKVVLIDFWATWCGPCRNALPHIRQIAKKFEGQPLVVVSISVDKDRDKWKSFVSENGMTWIQYCDGGFGGEVAKLFGVNAIPATFSIDADGVLEDQHVGDADIEGKLKKMVARANEVRNRKPLPAVLQTAGDVTN
jgi:thiol-disulfide isomerase/thioredoxin